MNEEKEVSNRTSVILILVGLFIGIILCSLITIGIDSFQMEKNADNNINFNYNGNWIEMELQNSDGKIIDYDLMYGHEIQKEDKGDIIIEKSFDKTKPLLYDSKLIYAFNISKEVKVDNVKIVITSNKELERSGTLQLRYLETCSVVNEWLHNSRCKYKELDFTDLQTKNDKAKISLNRINGLWTLEILGATDFDPTIADIYTSSSVGVYNDTIYDPQKAGIRLKTDALLIMDYDDATNDQTRVQDYSLWNQTVWNSTGQLGIYNTTDCIFGNCWEFNGVNTYQNFTKYEVDATSIFNFNDSFSVHYCSKIDVQSAGGPVMYRRSTYGWAIQSSVYNPDFFFDTPSGNSNCASTVNMNDSLWHCYDFIYYGYNYQASPNRTVFKDGVWSHSCTIPVDKDITQTGNVETVIGTVSVYSTWFNGTLDNIQIYNRSLTNEEVLYLNTSGNTFNWAYPSGNWTSPSYFGQLNTSIWNYIGLDCSVWNNSYVVYSDCANNVTINVMQSMDNSTWGIEESATYNGTDYILPENITQNYLTFITYFNNVTEWLTPVVTGMNLSWLQSTAPNTVYLFYPDNESTVTENPTFQWYNTTDLDGDALNYSIELANDTTFLAISYSEYEIAEQGNGTDLNMTHWKFANITDGSYYWRVWSSTLNNTLQENSSYSETWVFTKSTVTSTDDNHLWGLTLIIFVIGLGMLLLYTASILNEEHALLQTFFIMTALGIFLAGVHIMDIVMENVVETIGLADEATVLLVLDDVYLIMSIVLYIPLFYFMFIFLYKMGVYVTSLRGMNNKR